VNDVAVRWRADDTDKRIVLACHGPAATSSDPIMCVASTAQVAAHVVEVHNASLEGAAWDEGHEAGVFDADHPNMAPHPNPYRGRWWGDPPGL
jgi:hypothetical protein